MEHNKEKNTVQRTKYPVVAEERSGRTEHSRRTTNDNPMFSAKCQAEKRNFDIHIPLIYTNLKMLNERFLWNIETSRKEKQNSARRKKFHDHGT